MAMPEMLCRSMRMAGSVRTKSPMAPPRMTRMRGALALHQVCSDLGHLAALTFEEIHVRHPRLSLQAIARVNEAIRVST